MFVENIPVLTIAPPYGETIAKGLKHFETREKRCNYSGPVLILSSKNTWGPDRAGLSPEEYKVAFPVNTFPGNIIAIATLTECIRMDKGFISCQTPEELNRGFWSVGRYAYRIENARPVVPVPARGMPSTLFKWSGNIEIL